MSNTNFLNIDPSKGGICPAAENAKHRGGLEGDRQWYPRLQVNMIFMIFWILIVNYIHGLYPYPPPPHHYVIIIWFTNPCNSQCRPWLVSMTCHPCFFSFYLHTLSSVILYEFRPVKLSCLFKTNLASSNQSYLINQGRWKYFDHQHQHPD